MSFKSLIVKIVQTIVKYEIVCMRFLNERKLALCTDLVEMYK